MARKQTHALVGVVVAVVFLGGTSMPLNKTCEIRLTWLTKSLCHSRRAARAEAAAFSSLDESGPNPQPTEEGSGERRLSERRPKGNSCWPYCLRQKHNYMAMIKKKGKKAGSIGDRV